MLSNGSINKKLQVAAGETAVKRFPFLQILPDHIAKPLTILTQKNKTYVWGEEQEEAFQILKDKLCDAPVLALPDRPEDFIVCTVRSTVWEKVPFTNPMGRNKRRKPLESSEGDHVLLKVLPWKGVVRFRKKGKLAPRYVGPFEITERIGPVAYSLRLSQELNSVHDTFHVSNFKKCLADPTLQIPLEEIQVDAKLNFVEEPVEILEREIKKLKRSRILIVKVRWNSKRGPEFTWEHEDQMKLKYPHLFNSNTS
ncbi:hypothetical protein Tco_0942858 [Tanacetum coccineum]